MRFFLRNSPIIRSLEITACREERTGIPPRTGNGERGTLQRYADNIRRLASKFIERATFLRSLLTI